MRECPVLEAVRTPLALLALAVVGPAWCPAVASASTKHARSNEAPFSYNTTGIVGIAAAPASVAGPAVLQFQGLAGASYDPAYGQPIALGQFVPTPASVVPGTTTTYNNTPFEVEIHAAGLDKTSTVPLLDKIFPGLGKDLSLKTLNENSVILKGTLSGTVGGNGQANLTETVDTVKLGSFDVPTKDHITHYTFPIHFSQLKLPAGWIMAGSTVPTATPLGLSTPMIPAAPPTATATAPASPMIAQAQLIAGAPGAIAPAPSALMATVGTPTPTPEPSTILLFAAAFGGLALARGRRRRRPGAAGLA